MMDFLRMIQDSHFCQWISGSNSMFAYPGILFLHIFGMAIIVAISAAVCLRTLGYLPQVPFSAIDKFFPVLWIAFWVNVASGTLILAADATDKMRNPDFLIKMICVFAVVGIMKVLRSRLFRDGVGDGVPVTSNNKVLAVLSMILWLGVITTGRLLAYVGPGGSVG